MRETPLTNKIRLVLTAAGAFVSKTHGSNVGSGLPDLLACYHGAFIALEVKRPGRKREGTALQERTLSEIRAAGGWAGVVNDLRQVQDLLRCWPFVCRYCLGGLVPSGEYGLWCPVCKSDGGYNG